MSAAAMDAHGAPVAAARGPSGAVGRYYRALAPRERMALWLGVGLLSVASLWLVAIAPAWRTVREVPARLEQLDAQLQQMRVQAAQAAQWRARPALPPGQSQAALSAATARLNETGRLTWQGERAVLTLRQVSGEALQSWLAEARSGARARVIEAELTRSGSGYDGSVIVALGSSN